MSWVTRKQKNVLVPVRLNPPLGTDIPRFTTKGYSHVKDIITSNMFFDLIIYPIFLMLCFLFQSTQVIKTNSGPKLILISRFIYVDD